MARLELSDGTYEYINSVYDLKNIIAQLSVDSKYWLYINSQMVIREGQLKRGEEKESIYYDETYV